MAPGPDSHAIARANRARRVRPAVFAPRLRAGGRLQTRQRHDRLARRVEEARPHFPSSLSWQNCRGDLDGSKPAKKPIKGCPTDRELLHRESRHARPLSRVAHRKRAPENAGAGTAGPMGWVVSPGGLPQVNATTRDTVSGGIGGLPGLRVLSCGSPSTPSSAKRCCHRTNDADPGGDLPRRPTLRRCKDQLCPLYVLALTVPVRDDRRQPLAVRLAKDDAYCLGHAARFAQPPVPVNQANTSEH
jgi:hypothetical protein